MLRSWWRRTTRTAKNTPSPTRRRGFRPEVTALEERCLLTVQVLPPLTGSPPTLGFQGLTQAQVNNGVEPPDTVVAAGPAHVVELTSGATRSSTGTAGSAPQLAVFDKQLGGVVFQADLSSFFQTVGAGTNLFAPQVTFDEQAQRFVVVAAERDDAAGRAFLDLAVSDSADPTQGFTEKQRVDVTEFAAGAGALWADSPKLGRSGDAYVVAVNMNRFSDNAFAGRVQVVTFAKASLLDLDPRTVIVFRGNDRLNNDANLVPAVIHGSAAGGPLWFVEEAPPDAGNPGIHSTLRVVKMTNPLSVAPTFTDFTVAVTPYAAAVPPRQPNGVSPDPTIDTRVLNAALSNGRLVAAQNTGTGPGGVTLARWYDINVAGAAPVLTQNGDVARGFGVSTFYPSIEIAPNGDLGMTFLESGPTESMSMYVTGQTAGDAPGVMQTPTLAKGGEANYQGARAGRYSGISLDPTLGKQNSFWAANEYALQAQALDNWGSWIANFSVAGPDPNSPLSREGAFLNQVYQDLLGRPIDAAGLGFWGRFLDLGATRAQVVNAIEASQEFRTRIVQGLYPAILGRAADPAGINFFVQVLNGGGTVEQVKAMMLGSDEFFQNRGGGTNVGFLQALYAVALNRQLDPGGQQYYSKLLAVNIPRQLIALQVVTSLEAEQLVVKGYYTALLRRDADAAGLAFFSSLLASASRATQPIVVSDAPPVVRDETVIATIAGSDEYLRNI